MKENIEEEKAIKYYQNKDISFSVDFDTKKLLEALGITEEDSFENHQIRFKTLLNLIEKLQKENEELKHKYDKALSDLIKIKKEQIPVQKVKDEIEELEKNTEDYFFYKLTSKDIRKTIVAILQELLESEDR